MKPCLSLTIKEGLVQTAGLSESLRPKRSDFIEYGFFPSQIYSFPDKNMQNLNGRIFFYPPINSRPAVDGDHSFDKRLLFIGEMPLDKLSAFISHLPVESELLTFVIDERGTVLADSLRRYWGQILKADFKTGKELKRRLPGGFNDI